MTIQTINLTVPGGDTPRSANTKINANFADATHAASRLVGTATGEIPLAEDTFKASVSIEAQTLYNSNSQGYTSCNQFPIGSVMYVSPDAGVAERPLGFTKGDNYVIKTSKVLGSTKRQDAYGYTSDAQVSRLQLNATTWSPWVSTGQTVQTYNTTTASGANVVVDTTGKLMRSTSSEQYKNILAPLVLDEAKYAQAMSLRPIVYRSTADADNPAHHFYSFSAEELGAYDPAFTLWRYTEQVTDADGITTEQPLAERQAEGININALLAMSHAIAIKQDKLIKAQAAAIATLTQRIDAITT